MTTKENKVKKLYDKAKRAPNNFPFSDLLKLAEAVGYVLRKDKGGGHKGGSHIKIYRHSEYPESTMNFQPGKPKAKAKRYQVDQLLDAINDYDLL